MSQQATKNKEKHTKIPSKWMPLVTHVAAYLILLIASALYFKPIAIDGMSFIQGDNVHSMEMQTEITKYQESTGQYVRWTNQIFGGMPTCLMVNHNINYINQYVAPVFRLFQPYNEWICLLFIMLGAYIGLTLLQLPLSLRLGLSIVLGLFTSNTLFLAAGHTGKILAIATMPMVIGSFFYAYRKNLYLGTAAFALTLSYHICRNHVQITYYMYLGLAIFGLFFLFDAIREKQLPKFAKFAGAMTVATLLGVFSNLGMLWPNYEYSQESTRGKTELAQKATKNGLDPQYVFDMSLEKSEVAMLMFPNFYGGAQNKFFINREGSASESAFQNPRIQQELKAAADKAKAPDFNEFVNHVASQYMRQYRGSQRICGGPIYYGVVVCFLLILSLLLVRGTYKWGFVAMFTFFVVLAWGNQFAVFNDLMYNYFPMYSKFRDTKMTLLAAQPFVILFIGMGLLRLVNFKAENYADSITTKMLGFIKQDVSKKGYVLLATTISLAVCVAMFLYLSVATLSAPSDKELAVISKGLVSVMQADRAMLAKSDVFVAIGFILAAAAILFLYAKSTINLPIMAAAITLIACIDLNLVNSDYINENSYTDLNYTEQAQLKAQTPFKADKDILEKDASIYNVVDYSQGYPSQSSRASSFHKSMGGYFAAKPMLYQELWTFYGMDESNIALQQHSNIMNMLNVKYLILSPTQIMDNPTALGNAWFVENIQVVKNADEELAAIDKLEPVLNAVVQEKYADYVKGLNVEYSPGDRIYLEKYHPDTMTYRSEAAKDRFAVFSEIYYPPAKGWNVYLDGVKIDPFVKTNYLLRGLKIPAGKHEIKMVFEPTSINAGRLVGAICSLLIIILFVFFGLKYYQSSNEA